MELLPRRPVIAIGLKDLGSHGYFPHARVRLMAMGKLIQEAGPHGWHAGVQNGQRVRPGRPARREA